MNIAYIYIGSGGKGACSTRPIHLCHQIMITLAVNSSPEWSVDASSGGTVVPVVALHCDCYQLYVAGPHIPAATVSNCYDMTLADSQLDCTTSPDVLGI